VNPTLEPPEADSRFNKEKLKEFYKNGDYLNLALGRNGKADVLPPRSEANYKEELKTKRLPTKDSD
jgi:hypothetical protein